MHTIFHLSTWIRTRAAFDSLQTHFIIYRDPFWCTRRSAHDPTYVQTFDAKGEFPYTHRLRKHSAQAFQVDSKPFHLLTNECSDDHRIQELDDNVVADPRIWRDKLMCSMNSTGMTRIRRFFDWRGLPSEPCGADSTDFILLQMWEHLPLRMSIQRRETPKVSCTLPIDDGLQCATYICSCIPLVLITAEQAHQSTWSKRYAYSLVALTYPQAHASRKRVDVFTLLCKSVGHGLAMVYGASARHPRRWDFHRQQEYLPYSLFVIRIWTYDLVGCSWSVWRRGV